MPVKSKSRFDGVSYRCLDWLCDRLGLLQCPLPSALAAPPRECEPPVVWPALPFHLNRPLVRKGITLRHFKSALAMDVGEPPATLLPAMSPLTPPRCNGNREGPLLREEAPQVSCLTPPHVSTARVLSDLQDEVSQLRAQLQELLASQKAAPGPLVLPASPLRSSIPPPPPPPPPLTLMVTPNFKVVPGSSKPKDVGGAPVVMSQEQLLHEALKGLGKVKLREVEKSPCGTPLRRSAAPTLPSDHAGLLAVALKQRFLHIHPVESSPSAESTPEKWSSGSPRPMWNPERSVGRLPTPRGPIDQLRPGVSNGKRHPSQRNLEMSTVLSPIQGACS